MEIVLRRTADGFIPDTDFEADDLKKIPVGTKVLCEVKQPQCVEFHAKLVLLTKFLYQQWDQPDIPTKWGVAKKSFDRFRKDLTILSGHYEQFVRLNGEIQTEAKSWKFSRMPMEEREELYHSIINVALERFMAEKGYNEDEIINALLHWS